MVVLSCATVAAAQVLILDMQYKGNITVLNSTVKYGYAPSYQQGEYRAEMYAGPKLLERIPFEAPHVIYTDATENGELRGGKIILAESRFALALPYYDEMDRIDFYEGIKRIGKHSMPKPRRMPLWPFVLGGILLAGALIMVKNKAFK